MFKITIVASGRSVFFGCASAYYNARNILDELGVDYTHKEIVS